MTAATEQLARRIVSDTAERNAELTVENEVLRSKLATAMWLVGELTSWVEGHGCRGAFAGHLVTHPSEDKADG